MQSVNCTCEAIPKFPVFILDVFILRLKVLYERGEPHIRQNSQPSIQTKPTPFYSPRALREHLSGSMIPPSLLVTFFQGVAWLGSQLRTSNDHCFIVGFREHGVPTRPPLPPTTASVHCSERPSAQLTAPIYFRSDGPDPSESLSHPPRLALLPASPHCRTQPQLSPSLPASLDYNQIAPPSPATRQRRKNYLGFLHLNLLIHSAIQNPTPQDAQKGRSARPQPMEAPEA